MMKFTCPYNRCDYETDSSTEVLTHLRDEHGWGVLQLTIKHIVEGRS